MKLQWYCGALLMIPPLVILAASDPAGSFWSFQPSQATSSPAPTPTITLNGDVTGPSNANTVVAIQGFPVSTTTPSNGQGLCVTAGKYVPCATPSPGFSAQPTPTITLGGDVTGASNANTVVAVQGFPWPTASPTSSAVPSFNTATGKWLFQQGGTALTANTGTSGHTLGFLDGTNTASGVWAFNNAGAAAAVTMSSVAAASAGTLALTDTGVNGVNLRMTGDAGGSKVLKVSGNVLQVANNAYNTAILSLNDAGALTVTSTVTATLASSTAALNYTCYNSGTGLLTYDGSGTCLVSREDMKDILGPIDGQLALNEVTQLRPIWAKFKDSVKSTSNHAVQPMLGALATAKVDKRLVSYDAAGDPHGVLYMQMSAVTVAALQEQQKEIRALELGIRPRSTLWQRLRWIAMGE